jgi:AcrR family transcriptional regulator
MPKIKAESVAQHRNQQRERIVEAALEILISNGPKAVTPGRVAKDVGISRPAVYQYFASGTELLAVVIADAFELSLKAINQATAIGLDPLDKIQRYINCVITLAAQGFHRPATAIQGWSMPSDFDAKLKNWHRQQTQPVLEALHELGVTQPLVMVMIGGIVETGIKAAESGLDPQEISEATYALIGAAITITESGDSGSNRSS